MSHSVYHAERAWSVRNRTNGRCAALEPDAVKSLPAGKPASLLVAEVAKTSGGRQHAFHDPNSGESGYKNPPPRHEFCVKRQRA